MIGFRGASRYYDPRYRAGFALECRAMKKVRDEMGLTNVKLMIPFCRTVEEGRRVLAEMAKHGLKRGEDGLEVYVMCEIPSNVILAERVRRDLRRLLDRLERPDPAHPRRRPRLARSSPTSSTSATPAVKTMIAERHRDGQRQGPQDRHLRPGAERLSRVRAVPRRARHRQHLAQSGHGAQDDGRDLRDGKRKQAKAMNFPTLLGVIAIAIALLPRASAHCDGLDGPVVQAAQKALETGNVNLVLIWVQKPDEAEIKRAFDHAQAVRKLSAEARELADRYFFETLVRIHRAGEGAPFTGLKPAGRDLGPAIPAADNALRDGTPMEC